jgi:hypothetical protein
MGTSTNPQRFVTQTARIAFSFTISDRAVQIRVSNEDSTVIAAAGGDTLMQRSVDKGMFRDAMWNAAQIAKQKAEALAHKGNKDDDLCSTWTAQRAVEELLYLLELGVEKDRELRGAMRAVHPDALDDNADEVVLVNDPPPIVECPGVASDDSPCVEAEGHDGPCHA